MCSNLQILFTANLEQSCATEVHKCWHGNRYLICHLRALPPCVCFGIKPSDLSFLTENSTFQILVERFICHQQIWSNITKRPSKWWWQIISDDDLVYGFLVSLEALSPPESRGPFWQLCPPYLDPRTRSPTSILWVVASSQWAQSSLALQFSWSRWHPENLTPRESSSKSLQMGTLQTGNIMYWQNSGLKNQLLLLGTIKMPCFIFHQYFAAVRANCLENWPDLKFYKPWTVLKDLLYKF